MPTVKEIITSQGELAKYITNFLTNSIDKLGPEKRTLSHFEARNALLERYWTKFFDQHDLLIPHLPETKDHAYVQDDIFSKVEEEYLTRALSSERKSKSFRLLRDALPPMAMSRLQANRLCNPHCRKSNCPRFRVSKRIWESYKHRFTAWVISQPSMSPVTKLQHLLSTLQGDAEHRVRGLPILDSNFNVAWDRLVRRYDNLNIRLSTHLEVLINLPSVRNRNARDLASLIDKAEESVQALRDLKCYEEEKAHFIVHCVLRKLDTSTKEAWNVLREGKNDFPTYKELVTFLERRLQTLEQTQSSTPQIENRKSSKSGTVGANAASTSMNKTQRKCPKCNSDHALYACPQFEALTVSERYNCVTKLGLCRNCFARSHRVAECASKFSCKQCHQKHHTKLHRGDAQSQSEGNVTGRDDSNSSEENNIVAVHSTRIGGPILLATAEVEIKTDSGLTRRVRALIDPASEASFVTERVTNYLSLRRSRVSTDVTGVGAQTQTTARSSVQFSVSSLVDNTSSIHVSALVLSEISDKLPGRRAPSSEYPHLAGLTLADPRYGRPRKIDLLLGADKFSEIIRPGLRLGPCGTPTAQQSIFGWLLTGPADVAEGTATTSVSAYHIRTEPSLSQALQKFWELEEIPASKILTPDEQFCEKLYLDTVIRRKNGRFAVRLPLRSPETIVATREIAAASLIRSEKQRSRNSELNCAYIKFMEEYRTMGHMRLATPEEIRDAQYYMPHHGVLKAETKKLRVVFNASQKGSNGKSLNDFLLPGPKLQGDITLILTRWRFFKYAFTADIVKMFRQFDVQEPDLRYQHILWRADPSQPMQDFCLTTVTYGTAAAPFLAIRTMLQLAHEGESKSPEAAQIIRQQTYVDDAFAGADSIEKALVIKQQLIELLKSAQLELVQRAASGHSAWHSPLTRCYLEHVHRITLHGGIQLMRSHLARSVWITNGLRVLQGVYHRCVTCTRYQARPSQQRMAPLPEDCVTPTRIFEVSGVDFAGPFALRMSKGTGSKRMKGYVCIFVCMLTKAVYIEVVTGLTVDDFLAAYSRFTGRRGVCRIIYSDNATTFKAASKELTRLLQEALQMKGGIVDAMAALKPQKFDHGLFVANGIFSKNNLKARCTAHSAVLLSEAATRKYCSLYLGAGGVLHSRRHLMSCMEITSHKALHEHRNKSLARKRVINDTQKNALHKFMSGGEEKVLSSEASLRLFDYLTKIKVRPKKQKSSARFARVVCAHDSSARVVRI
ncbi:unnamed protein product [Trichogramma brassicae]|uniref:Uncharacterized protein n=1 Tax=Trichogramma brassicae TaxID=86971 RepID=A0A6H5HZ49_9HYME|nr:unnamed protein product [Trichogramma brassicae]